jgi:hypothetical protein
MTTASTIIFFSALLKLEPKRKFFRIILEKADNNIVRNICELALNFLHNESLSIDGDCLRRLNKRKKILQYLASRKIRLVEKRRIIVREANTLSPIW